MPEVLFNRSNTNSLIRFKSFLDEKVDQYNQPFFIENDPICIPHRFSKKEDIEIAGFLAATIAWGNRKSILGNARKLIAMMDNEPYSFIKGFKESDLKPFTRFIHRTFNGDDCIYFLNSLKNIYNNHTDLESVFLGDTVKEAITNFRNVFFEIPHLKRTLKHVANPEKKASAKRINMFLRWMVRKDDKGVDFGIWKNPVPSMLMCPLDIHSGSVSRKLGLLKRKQNDWWAVDELTSNLRILDPADPVRYDYALFGLGVFDNY